jgi:hypothetical protein
MSQTIIVVPQPHQPPEADASAASPQPAKPALSSRELTLLIALVLIAATALL